MIYGNRVKGEPTILPTYPPLPEHQQTTCHNEFPSVMSMLWQRSDTKQVAHATHRLKQWCPQKYLSLESVQQLY